MADTIDIGRMADTVVAMLAEYKDLTNEVLASAVKKTVSETVARLKTDPTPKQTGGYRKSWRKRVTVRPSGSIQAVVYSKMPHLTHLLEFGHAKVGKKGGRTKAIPHIKPAEEFAVQRVEQLIKEGMRK